MPNSQAPAHSSKDLSSISGPVCAYAHTSDGSIVVRINFSLSRLQSRPQWPPLEFRTLPQDKTSSGVVVRGSTVLDVGQHFVMLVFHRIRFQGQAADRSVFSTDSNSGNGSNAVKIKFPDCRSDILINPATNHDAFAAA